MIKLKIKDKGHLIDIPGMAPFRTPAEIDISKGDIRLIVGYLKVCNIQDYEIVASTATESETYRAADFHPDEKKNKKGNKKLEKRINKLENMIAGLYDNKSNDSGKNEEQITKQMEQFQKNVLDAIKNIRIANVSEKTVLEELKEEAEVAPFIPEIDIKDMKIRSQGKHKTMKKDSDTDDSADALSKLLK